MGEMIPANVLHVEIGHGLTINQMLDGGQVAPVMREYVVVHLNGEELPSSEWSTYVMVPGDDIQLYLRPAGGDSGKTILRLIATIAVIFIAFKLGAILGPKLATAGLVKTAETGVAIATASLTAIGTTLIAAFIPPPSINLPTGGYDTGESYFLTNQSNSARPYQPVPVPYGRVKMIGNLAAQPEIFSAGDSSLYTALLDWGLGQSNVFNYRAGDTKLGFFQALVKEHTNVPAWVDDDPSQGLSYVPLELLQYPLNSVELSIGLSSDSDKGIANTVPTAYSAVVELFFPQGIVYFDDQGNTQTLGVNFRGEYRKVGDPEFISWPSGTEGYAGDSHIWFGTGAVNPDLSNPSQTPNITFSVPVSRVRADAEFVATISFDRTVYAVDFTDFVFIDSATGLDVTDQFEIRSETEVTANRTWQYTIKAPSLADGETVQYIIATDAQNFIDAAPPYGSPFPSKEYLSDAFTVEGEAVAPDPDPDPGDPDPPPPNVDPSLYDLTEGNETYVIVTGTVGNLASYTPGDASTWTQDDFKVFVRGEQKTIYYGNYQLYAGVQMTYSADIGFFQWRITEYWSLKNADGLGSDNRFISVYPWDGTTFGNLFTIYGNKSQPAKASIVIIFPEEGEYEIRITRVGDNSNAEKPQQYVSTCYWSRLASRGYPYFPDTIDGRVSILNLQRRHTMTEVRLEASERVQGNLNEISATVVSQLRRWSVGDNAWTEPHNSRNPAWIVADILTGYRAQQVKVPTSLQDDGGYLSTSDLNMNSFVQFAVECNTLIDYEYRGETLQRRKYEIDIVLASDAPVIETVQNILSQCRARLILNQAGKLEIMMDVDKASNVRQVFTPANSWAFSGERIYQELPHGLRVEFVSPELGYQKGTVEVFRPPFTKETATTFEDLKTFGISNWHMAAQYGMYVFAQMILRNETFTLNVAAESLVVQVGDVVEVASDTAALGGGAHLITNQPAADTFVLSEEPFIYDDPHYTMKTDSGVIQGRVLSIVGTTIQIDKNVSPILDGAGVGVIVIGEKDLVTKKYVIKEIRPLQDLAAELTLIPYDSRVYRTDEGEFPEWNPGGDGDPQNPENGGNARTVDLTGFTYLEYEDRQPISVSDLSWDLETADSLLSGWKIQWTQEGQDTAIDIDLITSDKRGYQHKYNAINGEFGPGYYVVTPISQLGYEGQGAEVFVGKSIDRIPPPPPSRFKVVAYPTYLAVSWVRPDCPDLAGYTLTKADRILGGVNEVTIDYDEEQHIWFIPLGRYGSYFEIYATDTSGNNSETVQYDGLGTGVPTPPLVVPFWYRPKEYNEDGTLYRLASVNWRDVYSVWDREPSELISHYDLRYDDNVNGTTLATTIKIGDIPHPSQEYFLPVPNGYPDEGKWYISAVDHFGKRGPWNWCTSEDLNYEMTLGYFQTINYYELGHANERQPWTNVVFDWSATGPDSGQVTEYKLWLFPRQPEFPDYPYTVYDDESVERDLREQCYYLPDGTAVPLKEGEERYLGAVLWYEGADTHTEVGINQLPNYNKYHQGTFIIEGLVNGENRGTREAADWQIEYDREGPEAPPDFRFVRNEENVNQIALLWMPCSDPDVEFYEIRYASRVDAPWDTSMIIGQPDFYHDGYDGVSAEGYVWFDEFRAGKYMIRAYDTTGNIGRMSEIEVDAGGVDPTEGWKLIQSIEGHNEWNGTLENLYRIDGAITIFLDEDTPMIDGYQTAYFTYDETADIELLSETRIISETLEAFENDRPRWEYVADWTLLAEVENMAEGGVGSSNVTLVHEVKLPNSEVWQEFADSEFVVSGEMKFRIKLLNDELGGDAGIRRSRVLVYAKDEEARELKWPETTKTQVIRQK